MADLILAGTVLLVVGLGVIVAAMVSEAAKGETQVRGGGVVMIGPIPIIFGSDVRWASAAVVLAIVLMVVAVLMYAV